MDIKTLASSSDTQFYPTPPELAKRMFAGLDWDEIQTVLEPSAGKGDLIEAIGREAFDSGNWKNYRALSYKTLEVDCLEIDPYLRSILKYQFGDERKSAEYENCLKYDNGNLKKETLLYQTLDKTAVRIVHDDFLTYKPYKRYDLIAMNPPFKDGDKHLMHALDIQKGGGAVICILNAETLRNPCTNARRELAKRLDKLGATVEYVEGGFANAERKTDVEAAIVKAYIPAQESRSDIFDRIERAAEAEEFNEDATDLAVSDFVEAAVQQYNYECRAGMELMREYKAMVPRIMKNVANNAYDHPMLILKIDGKSDLHVNDYLKMVRGKYWRWLFNNEKVTGKLTARLQSEYMDTIDEMRNYDFTIFNIKQVMVEMNAQIISGIKNEIMNIFDKLTAEHSWFPDNQQNIHYYNGWAANKAHKLGKKSIVPAHLQTNSWDKRAFDISGAYGLLSDIEKVFDYLSGNMSREPMKTDILSALNAASESGRTRKISCTYFDIDIYKKGTVHIKYTYPELVERLNIYAAQNRNWLPPNYGKVRYSEMTEKEKAVVNDFHRDESEAEIDTAKSAKRYESVCKRSEFYLADPAGQTALLEASAASGDLAEIAS
jgi:hypothetical protein